MPATSATASIVTPIASQSRIFPTTRIAERFGITVPQRTLSNWIAEYRDVVPCTDDRPGPIRFAARIERRLLHFWRCRVEARAADGEVVLRCAVTLAPGRTT